MANKPAVILDPHFRRIEEIFEPADLERLHALADVVWGKNEPMPAEEFDRARASAFAVITAHWHYGSIDDMPKLKAIMEVGGRHPSPKVLDYPACFARGIRVLSCAPAFGPMVAEMALGLTIASARDRRRPHRLPRGKEISCTRATRTPSPSSDRRSASSALAAWRATSSLCWPPSAARSRVFDPWLPPPICRTGRRTRQLGTPAADLARDLRARHPVRRKSPCSTRERLGSIPQDAVLVLISRSHLVDFDALTELLHARRFKAAIDVFPQEPPPLDHPIRTAPRRRSSPRIAPAPSPVTCVTSATSPSMTWRRWSTACRRWKCRPPSRR